MAEDKKKSRKIIRFTKDGNLKSSSPDLEIVPEETQLKILIVEDNEGDFVLAKEMLADAVDIAFKPVESYKLTRAERLTEAVKELDKETYDLILLDLSLPDAQKFDAFHRLQLTNSKAPIILLTGLDDIEIARKAVYQGAQDFLIKGKITGTSLWRAIIYAIERKRAEEERKSLEAKLNRGKKLESLGLFAGGLAHDLNNLLQGVLNCTNLANLCADKDPALLKKQLTQIETLVWHSEKLISKLFSSAGKVKFAPEKVNLTQFIHETKDVFEATVNNKIDLEYELNSEIPEIEIDSSQLRQIAINLVSNSSEAIADSSGRIKIKTGVIRADNDYLNETYLDDDLPEGFYSFIEVKDNGPGMDENTKERIFEPFYTTKKFGQGLGLASVLGIIRNYKGAIKINSKMGYGTKIKVLFPIAEQAAQSVTLSAVS